MSDITCILSAIEQGDPYAAEHEAEFFAVASEAFFESPNALRREFPKLYELFRGFYRQDPAARLEA